nr:hypothetical protein Iba_chr07cCG1290 [Ipomoea batatas]
MKNRPEARSPLKSLLALVKASRGSLKLREAEAPPMWLETVRILTIHRGIILQNLGSRRSGFPHTAAKSFRQFERIQGIIQAA